MVYKKYFLNNSHFNMINYKYLIHYCNMVINCLCHSLYNFNYLFNMSNNYYYMVNIPIHPNNILLRIMNYMSRVQDLYKDKQRINYNQYNSYLIYHRSYTYNNILNIMHRLNKILQYNLSYIYLILNYNKDINYLLYYSYDNQCL